MKKILLRIFPFFATAAIASCAYGVTIIPMWDSTITSDPHANAITNGILLAIGAEDSNVLDNLTVSIEFAEMSSGLGQSETYYTTTTYSSYLAALKNSATSVNDFNALSQLPNGPGDPVENNIGINLFVPLARLLGFYSGFGNGTIDSTIYLNTSIMNFTRPPGDPSKYDLIAVCEHEMDEVLGTGSGLPNFPNGPIFPEDLFRYQTNSSPPLLTRTYVTTGDSAYFSVDGTNLLARFNMVSGGDYGDWWSFSGHWAPSGVTPYEQVQDAFGYPDTTPNLGSNELAALDVMGYTIVQPRAVMKVVQSGKNQVTISWLGGYVYTLQENTNLLSPNWVNSATGTTNPAVIISTNKVKFYRLSRSLPTVPHSQSLTGAELPLQKMTRVYSPNQ